MERTHLAPALSLRTLTKRYSSDLADQRPAALQDFTLDIASGEFVVVTGPSGCGKSTLLNLMAGLIAPTSGTVLLDGRALKSDPAIVPVVMFQELALFDWMTVRNNVAFGLKARGVPPAERRALADTYLGYVDLHGIGDRYPSELSGGMKQRVALARTLVVQPGCVLLDEPLSRLDQRLRLALQDELLRIWEATRCTVVLVTHDPSEAVYLADRIVVLTPAPGRLSEIITVDLPRPRLAIHRQSPRFLQIQKGIRAQLESHVVPV